MQYLNIEISTLNSIEFIGSEPIARATWLCVLGWCVQQENGGIIKGAEDWKDRQWQQTCGVTLEEIKASDGLVSCVDGDVHLFAYPLKQEARCMTNRASAKAGGKASGKARSKHSLERKGKEGNSNSKVKECNSNEMEDTAREQNGNVFGIGESIKSSAGTPEDEWRMKIQSEEWARNIKQAGGKIGPKSWETWQGMIERFTIFIVLEGIKGTTPSNRFADGVEDWIGKNKQNSEQTTTPGARRIQL